jgi:streptomycin 6-kinase
MTMVFMIEDSSTLNAKSRNPRMEFPTAFLQMHIAFAGEEGQAWVDALPALLARCEQRWGLTIGAPFRLSYNFAAPATHSDGAQRVIKVIAPYLDADLEADVLQLYGGQGAIELLEHDEANGVLLLERCLPGTELATLFPPRDDEATAVASDVMAQLWRPLPAHHPFPTLARYTGVLDRLPRIFGDSAVPLDARVLDAAIRLRAELLSSAPEAVLLHGDLHYHNILAARRQPWLAIDPKGVAGERAYEPSPLFYNPLGDWHARVDGPRLVQRRTDILVERAGLDRQRVLAWAVVQGVVSSLWDYEDIGAGSVHAEMVAEWALGLL